MLKIEHDAIKDGKRVLHNDHELGSKEGVLTIVDMPKIKETELDKLKQKVKNDTATEKEFRQFIKLQFGIDE